MSQDQEIKELEERLSSLKRAFYFWIAAFFIVVVVIIIASVVYIADLGATVSEVADSVNQSGNVTVSLERNGLLSADYMAFVIPVLITLAGSLLAFLGMNRLKMFDERIDRYRADILSEMTERVHSAVVSSQAEQSDAIRRSVEEQQEAFYQRVDKEIKKTNDRNEETQTLVSSFENAVSCSIASIEKTVQKNISDIDNKMKQFDEKYEWLKEPVVDKGVYLSFTTVSEAHTLTETLRRERVSNREKLITGIVERVTTSGELTGTAGSYHNLAAELARGGLYKEACRVLDKGLSVFKTDADLLSDLVEYATKVGDIDTAKNAVERIDGIDKKSWTWRCYGFQITFYLSAGELNRAYQLSDEAIKAIPNDEHGYSSKAEIEQRLFSGQEGINKAIATLSLAINNKVNCPQCANDLCEIMLSQGKYDEAIEYASRAIMELAQEQAHVISSHVFFNRATGYDRMFMQGIIDGECKTDLANNARSDYATALALGELAPVTAAQARERIGLLNLYMQEDGVDNNEAKKNFMSFKDSPTQLAEDSIIAEGENDTEDPDVLN